MSVSQRALNTWTTNLMLGGVRHRHTFTSQKEAYDWEEDARRHHSRGIPIIPPDNKRTSDTLMTIGELVRHVDREYWSSKKSGKTLARNAAMFRDHVGANTLASAALQVEVIRPYLEYRESALKNCGATLNRHRAAIIRLAHVGKEIGANLHIPSIQCRVEGVGRERIFSTEEENKIQLWLRKEGRVSLANLLIFLSDTGCRLGEAEKMPWSAFRENNLLTIPANITKSNKERTIALTARATRAVEEYRDKGQPNGPFSLHSREVTTKAWKQLRDEFEWMDETTVIHTFRHTCASRLVQEHGSLDMVQRWMGHASPLTTQRYAKYAPKNMQELAGLLEARQLRGD